MDRESSPTLMAVVSVRMAATALLAALLSVGACSVDDRNGGATSSATTGSVSTTAGGGSTGSGGRGSSDGGPGDGASESGAIGTTGDASPMSTTGGGREAGTTTAGDDGGGEGGVTGAGSTSGDAGTASSGTTSGTTTSGDGGATASTGTTGDGGSLARCGDGIVQTVLGEVCDQGTSNSATAYGPNKCTDKCQTAPRCGDGKTDPSEVCDDGTNSGMPGSCATNCSARIPNPSCGDGVVQAATEQCDKGAANGTAGGTCDATCHLTCGNGVKDTGEPCDDGTANNTGAYGKCSATCMLGPRCGDATINGPEQCDDGTSNGTANSTCDATCHFKCGNGAVDVGEQCDDGNALNTDACLNTCKTATCGDGFVRAGQEDCDLGASNAAAPYGPNTCTTQCKVGPFCGDGVKNGTEVCDDKNSVSGDGCSATCHSEVVSVAVGLNHTCAIISGGAVKCWGDNSVGQLGIGMGAVHGSGLNQMGDNLPTLALGTGRTAKAIAAGNVHSCALLDDGSVKCWGDNVNYEVTAAPGSSPVYVPGAAVDLGGVRATAIGVGTLFTCALLENGQTQCWGDPEDGKLGDNHVSNGSTPTTVAVDPALLSGKALTVAGEQGCILFDDMRIRCWGYNSAGAPGVNDTMSISIGVPTLVPALLATPQAVSMGTSHACALLVNNGIECWGDNTFGQLGLGDMMTRYEPSGLTALGAGRSAKLVAALHSHTCVILDDNSLKCWGDNEFGQLGLGDSTGRPTPATTSVPLGTGRTARFVAAGNGDHTCVVLDDGTLKCWGRNDFGQLGLGDTTNRGVSGSIATLATVDVVGTH